MASTEKPILTQLTFGEVDIRSGPMVVPVMATVSDADSLLSGVTLLLEVDRVLIASTSNTSSHGVRETQATTTLPIFFSTAGHGQSSVTLDPWTEGGTYTVRQATLRDPEGNVANYDTKQLAQAGLATNLTVVADEVPPVLIGLTLPGRVANEGQTVPLTISAQVSDPGQAFASVAATIHLDRPTAGGSSDLVLQGSLGSIYNYLRDTGAATFSAGGPGSNGVYHITGVTLTDYAGNVADYAAGSIAALGLPTSFSLGGPARADFDGNGESDLLWRKRNGEVSIWSADGRDGAYAFQQSSFLARVDTSWSIADLFDWNGDGRMDILWRDANGKVSVWSGQAGGFQQAAYGNSSVGTEWAIAGSGDLNGDGNGDLLWRNQDGSISSWLSTGTGFRENSYFHASVGKSWQVEGLGDFNGDGRADLLWRNNDGAVSTWNAAGTGFAEASTYRNPVDRSWHIVGIGDFNGDGSDDILWHNDNGLLSVWLGDTNGFTENRLNASAAVRWSVVGAGDYDGDGIGDVLWRDSGGAISIWQGTGNGWQENSYYEASVGNDWTIAGHLFPM